MNTTTVIFPDFIQYAIDALIDGRGEGVEASELHHEIFNTDYFIIGTYEAKKWLEENPGVFEAIGDIKEYEMDNFGQVTTDLSDPEKVVNMYSYIQGELLLSKSERLQERWDNKLTAEDCEYIKDELNQLL